MRETDAGACGRKISAAGAELPLEWRRHGLIMALLVFPLIKFLVKRGLAGGTVYVVYDQDLLSRDKEGACAPQKTQQALPLALDEWMKYFGWHLPAIPKTEFSLCNAGNSGVRTVIGAYSVALTQANEYTQHGWKYVKYLVK
ncbi:MICOS complex subunit MIC13-like [Sceloporus undulatus]|uniref:MICOS complex subunit MIC13-like n=1 Tax=Sceloporus undulatus TaxID=8520 RepID=UPI001C4BC683|nr:MICOS complex subunit MIC13-like [Sceloporus undulatus]